ncbi:hypothetical protein Tco_0421782, partial [Tanacetum coccineum]
DKQVFGQKVRDLDVESWKSRKVNTEADYGVIPTHRLRRNTLKAELSQQGTLRRNTSSTKRKLVVKLEAVGDEEGFVKALENLRVVVACDAVTLKELENLLAYAQVGIALKDGFVNDIQPME